MFVVGVGWRMTVFGGYNVFTSIRPSVSPSIHDFLVFKYLEKAMTEFEHLNEHL